MKIALVGLGVVGQGLVKLLHQKQAFLKEKYNFQPRLVAIAGRSKGALCDPNGLDLAALLDSLEKSGDLSAYPDAPALTRGLSAEDSLRQSGAEVLVEVTPTNLQTGEPALTHCRLALDLGLHVVTANKGPVALAFAELIAAAQQHARHFGFEGTVMGGTPTMTLGLNALAGCEIQEIRGILNGTTNYILTQMEAGQPYAEVLATAQALGYAEADPTADVEGYDALSKVLILANTLMGGTLKVEDAYCKGITGLSAADIASAQAENKRWKLIGSIRREWDRLHARVEPMLLPLTDPLASITGVTNAVTFTTDLLGNVTLIGPGAGQMPTAFAILSDLLHIHRLYNRP